MTDDRMDLLIRRLDVGAEPDRQFVETSLARLLPAARDARRWDTSPIGRLAAAVPWGRPARVSRRRPVPLLVMVALAVAVLLATLGLVAVGSGLLRLRDVPPSITYRAVVVRPDAGGLEVVIVDADGRERPLRRLTPADLGLDPGDTLNPYASVSQHGWLEVSTAVSRATDSHPYWKFGANILVDLADPARAPITVPGNGFQNGRWGPDGRWAHFCDEAPDCGPVHQRDDSGISGPVRVLDPELGPGSEIIVPLVQTFGGNPEIVWAADGTGFVARDGTEWGVTPIDGGPFVPGVPTLQSRWLNPSVPGFDDPTSLTQQGHGTEFTPDVWSGSKLSHATPVNVQLSADGEAIWQLLDDTDRPSPQALLARLTGPGSIASVRTFEIPSGPVTGFTLSPDDAFVAIYLGSGSDQPPFVLEPVTPGDPAAPGPLIHGSLAGLVPAAAADMWPSR